MRLKGFDSAPIDQNNIRNLGNRIIITGTLAIADHWLRYERDGLTTWDYVPKETLFNKDSLATLQMSPLAVEHPDNVTSDNYRKLVAEGRIVGQLSSQLLIDEKNNHLDIVAVVNDKPTIDMVLSGAINELSPSYWKTLDKHPDYSSNCFVQTARDYTGCEVSLCHRARGGKDAKLHISRDSEPPTRYFIGFNKEDTPKMATLSLDGISVEVPDNSKQFIEKFVKDSDTKTVTLTAERDAAIASRDALTTEVKDLQKEKAAIEATNALLAKDAQEIKDKAKKEQDSRDREDILKFAVPIFTEQVEGFSQDSIKDVTNRTIKEQAIAVVMPGLSAVKNKSLDSVSEAEINGYWESLKQFKSSILDDSPADKSADSDSINPNDAFRLLMSGVTATDKASDSSDNYKKSEDSYYADLEQSHLSILGDK